MDSESSGVSATDVSLDEVEPRRNGVSSIPMPRAAWIAQPPLLLSINSDGAVLYISPALASRLEVQPSTAVGMSFQKLPLFASFTAPAAQKGTARAGGASWLAVPRLLHDEHHGRVYETHVAPMSACTLVTLHDVTDAYQLKQYLQRHLPSDFATFSHAEPSSFRLDLKRWSAVSVYRFTSNTATNSNAEAPAESVSLPAYALDRLFELCEKWGATLERAEKNLLILRHSRLRADHSSMLFAAIHMACEYQRWLTEVAGSHSTAAVHAAVAIASGEMAGHSLQQEADCEHDAASQALHLCKQTQPGELFISDEALKALLAELSEDWRVLRTKPYQPGEAHEREGAFSSCTEIDSYLIAPRNADQLTEPPLSFTPIDSVAKSKAGIQAGGWRVRFLNLDDPSLAETLVAEEVNSFQDGKFFGGYRLIKMIRRSRDAEMYEAIDVHGRIVALKIFDAPEKGDDTSTTRSLEERANGETISKQGQSASPDFISRQMRAAHALSTLTHRNIRKIHEAGQLNGRSFIAMEAVRAVPLARLFSLVNVDPSHPKAAEIEQGSLAAAVNYLIERDLCDQSGRSSADSNANNTPSSSRILPKDQLLRILIQACEAVRLAHQVGVIHRGLTPEHILVRANGESIVTDFGESLLESHALDTPLSEEAAQALSYTSCEAAEGRADLDERADVYSLGAILYQGLTGMRPFVSNRKLGADIESLRTHVPKNLCALNTSIPEELELIVQKALEPEAALRYQSVSVFENDLRHHQLKKITSVSQVGHVGKRSGHRKSANARAEASSIRGRWQMWLGLIAMILLFASLEGGTWWWFQRRIDSVEVERQKTQDQLQTALAEAAARNEAYRTMAPSMLEMARWKLSQGAYVDALQHAQAALRFDPGYSDAHLFCAQMSVIGQDFQGALAALDDYVEAGGRNPYVAALREACVEALKKNVSPMERFAKIFSQQGASAMADAAYRRRDLLLEQYAQQVRTAFPDWKIETSGKLGWPDAFATSIDLSANHRALIQLDDGTIALNLYGARSTNLSGLKGLPISTLSLARSAITDLSPLADLPIQFLNLSGTQVSDLSIVERLPIKALICHDASAIADVSPLAGSSIHYLALDGTQVSDLAPLRGLQLAFLSLVMAPVSDLSPLQGMQSLTDLHFKLTRVTDLSPLTGLKLQRLSFDGQSIQSLAPLEGMPLTELYTSGLATQDLKPLSSMPLKNLSLEGAIATNLSPLQNLPLEYLDLSRTSVTDLSPLRSLPLRWLKLAGSSASDISQLALLPLEYLDLSDTPVHDLWPLRRAPLKSIVLFGSQVSDLSPLIEVPLTEILFEPSRITAGLSALRSISTLAKIGVVTDSRKALYLTPAEFWSAHSSQTTQSQSSMQPNTNQSITVAR